MPDNLSNFGIESDELVGSRRLKPKDKRRKRFAIESRIRRNTTPAFARSLGLRDWSIHSRYHTAESRDEALENLTKKAENDQMPWFKWEYRARDD